MTADKMKLERLRKLADRLNSESDSLNDAVLDIESSLQEMNLGISVWMHDLIGSQGEYEIVDDQAEPTSEVPQWSVAGWYMGYTKVGDSWRIVLKEVREEWEYANRTDYDNQQVRRIVDTDPGKFVPLNNL